MATVINLEQTKCAQLDLLTELKRICDQENIPYFLTGGTLLGAVRHDGFIPWDDDIDVGMLRNDYNHFIEACERELDAAYSLYDWDADPSSPLPFLKMKINGTHYTEGLSKDTKMNDGIYIDIFPYDNAPEGNVSRKIHGFRNILLKKILLLKYGFRISEGGRLKKIAYIPLIVLARIGSGDYWKKKYKRNAMRYDHRDTTFVVNLSGAYSYRREIKDKAILSDLVGKDFEGLICNIPRNYDVFLSEVYGDYMKLPPVSERRSRHDISRVDLGNYQIRSHLAHKSKCSESE